MSDYDHVCPLVSAVLRTWPISPCRQAGRQRLSRLSRPARHGFSSSFRQLRISQALTDSRAKQAIEPVHSVALHVPIAQPKGELPNVAMQMLGAGVVIDAVQAALKQRKDAFNAISGHVTAHIFTGAVVDAVMRVEQPANAVIERAFVCVDGRADLDVPMSKANRIASADIAVNFRLHFAGSTLSARDDGHLADASAAKAETLAFVLRSLFTTNITFVDFDNASQFGWVIATRFAQALKHEPSSLLRDADLRVKLDARNAFAGRNQQIHRIKPLVQWHLGSLENRAGPNRENEQVSIATIETSAFRIRPDALCFATSWAERTIRPPLPLEIDPCAFIVWECLEKLQQADGGLAHKNMLSVCVAIRPDPSCGWTAISDGAGVFARTGLCRLSCQFFMNENAVAAVITDHRRLFAQNGKRRAVDRAGDSLDNGELRTINDMLCVVAIASRNFDGQRFLAAIAASFFGCCQFKRGDDQIARFGVFDHLNHWITFLTGSVGISPPDKKITIRLDLACQQKSSLIYIIPIAIPQTQTAWEAVIQIERTARAAMRRYYDDVTAPLYADHDAGKVDIEKVKDVEAAYGAFTSAHSNAVNAAMLTPAPDLESVALKLEMGITDWVFDGSDEATEMLRVIVADIRKAIKSGGVQ